MVPHFFQNKLPSPEFSAEGSLLLALRFGPSKNPKTLSQNFK